MNESFGPPEVTELRVGSRMPDMNNNAPVVIGRAKGFYAAEGLTVGNVITEDVIADLATGALDVGGVLTGTLVKAILAGADIVAVSGKRCAMNYSIAIQPDITVPEELAGKQVVAGFWNDPATEGRLDLLAAHGWDVRSAGAELVAVSGGADVWTEMFYRGELAVATFYPRHRADMVAHGANIAVDERIEWPNDFFTVRREFLAASPNSVGRFLRATLRALAWYLDGENQDEALAVMEAAGFSTDLERRFFRETQATWCRNLYVQEQPLLNVLAFQRFEGFPPFDEIVDLRLLSAAQTDVGLDNAPTPGARHEV